MVILPAYRTLTQLHDGVNSQVYRAQHKDTKQLVILKLLKNDYPTQSQLARYRKEYNLTRQFNSHRIIKAYELEEHQRKLVMVLEDFGGISLKEWRTQERRDILSIQNFLDIAIQITESISELHSNKIIHKDINPSNIGFNSDSGEIKLFDLGIATEFSTEKLSVKSPGQIDGTLAYISPEQTGRTSRNLDYRTDFYSLGITFYELLTGQLPFQCFDPLELIHCHIAKPPSAPHINYPKIPKIISNLVMKLIAKNAEDRYQSAGGIRADLDYCQKAILHNRLSDSQIQHLKLGKYDFSEEFTIPQKLYGREQAIQILLNTFYQVALEGFNACTRPTNIPYKAETSSSNFILISGSSGTGKSVLVKELCKPITERKGYFITGKFSPLQHNIPYSAIVSAFSELIQQILGESEEKLYQWKQKIFQALGENAQIIIDVIPEVELILGAQPSVPLLGDIESQNRFNLVFLKFVRVFCVVEHPLVIVLDDLQWADSATLTLIDVILRDPSLRHLLLIGTFRSNEVSNGHPLHHLISVLEKTNINIKKIHLDYLCLQHVNQLISDTLHCDRSHSLPLAKLVLSKTEGNPFFVNIFINKLYHEKLIKFNPETRSWYWDIYQIEAQNITDNVAELMISKLQNLPESIQSILSFAACLGSDFCLQSLALVSRRSPYNIEQDLKRATQWGLIFPLSDTNTELCNKLYVFGHDRIHQAAYDLIPNAQKPQKHAEIGQELLRQFSHQKREDQIFLVVNQLNRGRREVATLSDQLELAQLNLMAGQRAKQSTAYDVAIEYFSTALELIEESAWLKHYSLALTLHQEIATAYYVRGKYEAMEIHIGAILTKSVCILDMIPAYELRVQSYLARSYLDKAVQTSIYVARILGIKISHKSNPISTALAALKTQWILKHNSPSYLAKAPKMNNLKIEAAVRILSSANSAAYVGQPVFLPLILSKQVELLFKYGDTSLSAFVYAWYGTFLCGRSLQINLGYDFGNLALKMLQENGDNRIRSKTLFIVNCMITPWKHHVSETLYPLQQAYQDGRESGDIEYASWAILVRCEHLFFMGQPLVTLDQKLQYSEDIIIHFKQDSALLHNQIFHQITLNLLGRSATPHHLFGNKFDESILSTLQIQRKEQTGLFHAYLCQLILCYLFEKQREAFNFAKMAAKYKKSAAGLLAIATFCLYDSLTHIRHYAKATSFEKRHILKVVAANQKSMRCWATHAPENYHHKWVLVKAERHRIRGHRLKAMSLYDQAIAGAKKQGYINEEALANELAANFYMSWGRHKIAQCYMRDAHYCYSQWGAIAKVQQLEECYPELLSQTLLKDGNTITQTLTAGSLIRTRSGLALDLVSVQKAYQTLSREIILEHLLKTMMALILENAGAQRGYLILPQGGELLIQASSDVEPSKATVLQAIPVKDYPNVSSHIINYVARTHKPMVLDNASTDPLVAHDPYIRDHRPNAVLCMPLLNQNQLQGIVYLENNLAVGAFTQDRVKVLELISGQAAIAITNAKLYSQVSHSEKQLKQFLEAIPVGITVLDTQGYPYYVNQHAQELLHHGLLPEGSADDPAHRYCLYRTGTDTLYPNHELPVVKALQGQESRVDDIEIHVMDSLHDSVSDAQRNSSQSDDSQGGGAIEEESREQGQEYRIALESWGTPIYDEAGNLQYALTAFQDITQRKQAENLLADYNQTLETQVAKRTEELQQANQELERLATLDGLTHIANRRAFDTYLFKSWRQQIEEPQPLSLILADIDYFKRYNDHYGHQAGDDCLVLVAQTMAKVAQRSMDLVARYGGEEFAIILPGTDLEGAAQVAEKIRLAVLALKLPHEASGVSDQVTLSLGVASIVPTLEQLLDDLIANADKALYQAKEQGRNRVVKLLKDCSPGL